MRSQAAANCWDLHEQILIYAHLHDWAIIVKCFTLAVCPPHILSVAAGGNLVRMHDTKPWSSATSTVCNLKGTTGSSDIEAPFQLQYT
jgi:hypothetical protein